MWLNTYLVGRLRALPPENDSHPTVPEVEPRGSVAMQVPNGVTSQQEAKVAPLPDRIDSQYVWEQVAHLSQGRPCHQKETG